MDDDAGTIVYQNGGRLPVLSPPAALGDMDEEIGGGMVGCRENVEILTRVSRKSRDLHLHRKTVRADETPALSVLQHHQGRRDGCRADVRQVGIPRGGDGDGACGVQSAAKPCPCIEGGFR